MGGLDDDAPIRPCEDAMGKSKGCEHTLSTTESNSKWIKEGQNQMCMQQQDQNLNLVENNNKSTERTQNQNSQRLHEEKRKTLEALCHDLSEWEVDPPLLIYSSLEMEKNQEHTGEEDNVDPTENEKTGSSRSQTKGSGNTTLFSRNGFPSEEDSSCMSISQGSAASTPDGGPGNRYDFRVVESYWNSSTFGADADLPSGWMRMQDTSGTYYWHVPTGTTQWESPGSLDAAAADSPSDEIPLIDVAYQNLSIDDERQQKKEDAATDGEFDGAAGQTSLVLLSCSQSEEDEEQPSPSSEHMKCFTVRSLGWVEISEEDMAPGRSSAAVNNCIQQLSFGKQDLDD
ncbi:hypothetical protein DNTS_005029, partial [Danionella cerebrum]